MRKHLREFDTIKQAVHRPSGNKAVKTSQLQIWDRKLTGRNRIDRFSVACPLPLRKHKPKSQGRNWKVSKRIQENDTCQKMSEVQYMTKNACAVCTHYKTHMNFYAWLKWHALGTKLSNSLVKISDIKIVKTCEDQSPVLWRSLPLRAT